MKNGWHAGLTAAVGLVLGACSGSSEPTRPGILRLAPYATDPVRVSLSANEARAEGAYGDIVRDEVMPIEVTDDVTVVRLDSPLVFEDLVLPPRSAFEAELRVFEAAALRGNELDVELEFGGDGWSERHERRVRLGAKSETAVPVSFACEEARPVTSLRLTARSPEPLPAKAQPRVVWVRMRARHALEPVTPARPVLWITLDTLRRDALGVYGGEVETPHLDRLARDSFLFEEAYATANMTNPSHASMFTGLYPKDHGVGDNFTKLDPACPTLIDELRAQGFRTGAFVASFNFRPDAFDLTRRFDDAYGCSVYFERRAADVNADVIPWLEAHGAEPFFAWVHYFDAHMPYAAPTPYRTAHEPSDEKIELPLRSADATAMYAASDDLAYWRSAYADEVRYLDDQVGELLAALDALGLYEAATIVAVADHGEQLGENHVYCEHRGLFEPTVAVPAMIKLPGRAGGRVAGLVSTVDLYPTLFASLGLDARDGLRGRDLTAALASGRTDRGRAFAEHSGGTQVSLRTDEWHALLGLADEEIFPRFAIRAGRFELFERGEATRELGAERADVADGLRAEIRSFLDSQLGFDGEAIDDRSYLEALEALGYTEEGPK